MKKLKEFLLSNKFSMNINVSEDVYASFQVMDENGKCYSPKDEGLRIDDNPKDNDYGFGGQGDWDENEKIYIGNISPDEVDFTYSKEEFLYYLDQCDIDDFEDIEDNMSKEEIKDFIKETTLIMIEEGIIDGFENQNLWGEADGFTAYGDNNNYDVWDYVIHEQDRYDITISIDM